MVLYGIMSHFLVKTQTLQLAVFPPVDEEKTSYTYSAKLRKILNEAVNQEIMEVSRITQVNICRVLPFKSEKKYTQKITI